MRKLLFIGGTGFLGQSFFDYLNKGKIKQPKFKKIYVVSRQNKKIKSKVKISFIKKNVANLKTLPLVDYIIYAANSQSNSENIKGIKNFVKLLTDNHKKAKILFTSSGAVYGKSTSKKKFKENQKIYLKKINKLNGYKKNYAKTKIFAENEFKKLGQKGFNVSITRLFTFIGKRILVNNNFALSNLLNQAQNPKVKYIILHSKNEVYRSYMNSNDLITWIMKILKKSSPKCEIYNIGSDEVTKLSRLSKLIANKFDKKVLFKEKKNTFKSTDFYVPSISKAKRKLNLSLKFNLKKSLNNLYK